MNTNQRLQSSAAALLLLSNFGLLTAFAQGSLTPPGAPAPSMKSLDQVEARTPVDATHTPGSGTNLFVITQPGSYYLTGNLNGVSNYNGISIQTNNVTLDLNGFQLNGNGSGSATAIAIGSLSQPSLHGITVRNGSIENWGLNGIDSYCAESKFINLLITAVRLNSSGAGSANSGYAGLSVRDRCLVSGCAVNNCPYARAGITALDGSIITDCTADFNGSAGILALGAGCTISRCAARANTGIGISTSASVVVNCTATFDGTGIDAGSGSTVQSCTAQSNFTNGITTGDGTTVFQCSVSSSGSNGIVTGTACHILNNTAYANTGSGIVFGSDCFITGNNSSANTIHGFRSTGSLNRIDGNIANHNLQNGFVWGNDYLVRNTAFANSVVNYSPIPGAGNSGPINAASSSTNPWANF